ncbi:hypothetical protein DLM75_23660 [Leptospira stimsonii]|uniref:Uncharacterized protein n=2 Tax=Leptospira stimsonii TaxID=2202203 RepID=A0A396YQ65_9LEPT|nr:hypothetical protein DLM75_23660 [Leptospira stimsonii]
MEIKLFYHNTLLRKFDAMNLEFRSFFPVPKYSKEKKKQNAFIIKRSLDSYVCAIVSNTESLYDIEEESQRKDEEIINDYLDSLELNFNIYSLDISLEEGT